MNKTTLNPLLLEPKQAPHSLVSALVLASRLAAVPAVRQSTRRRGPLSLLAGATQKPLLVG